MCELTPYIFISWWILNGVSIYKSPSSSSQHFYYRMWSRQNMIRLFLRCLWFNNSNIYSQKSIPLNNHAILRLVINNVDIRSLTVTCFTSFVSALWLYGCISVRLFRAASMGDHLIIAFVGSYVLKSCLLSLTVKSDARLSGWSELLSLVFARFIWLNPRSTSAVWTGNTEHQHNFDYL